MGTTTNYALRYPGLTDTPDGPTQIENLAEDVDAALDGAVNDQTVKPIFARKTTGEARSATSVSDDSELQLAGLESGGVYIVEGVIFYHGGADTSEGDLKLTFSVPSGSSGTYAEAGNNESAAYTGAFASAWTDTVTRGTTGVSATLALTIRGLLVAGADGTLKFRWCRDHSTDTNTTVEANSYLTGRRVA